MTAAIPILQTLDPRPHTLPASSQAAATSSWTPDPRKAVVTILLLILAAALLFTPGCVTVRNAPGRVLATSAQTVDAAMTAWTTYDALGHARPAQSQSVRKAYAEYQRAFAVAEIAYLASRPSTPSEAWNSAANVLRASQRDLLALIQSFIEP